MKILEKTKNLIDDFATKHQKLKYLISAILILFGLVALVTPFTPGAAFAIILGLQLIGINLIKAK